MEELYSWMMVALLLSGAGFYAAFMEGMRRRKELVEKVPEDATIEIMDEEVNARSSLSAKALIMSMMSFTPFLHTILLVVLIYVYHIEDPTASRVAVGALLAMGLSALFSNLGRYQLYEETILGMNEWNGGSTANFGKHVVFLSIMDPTSIYGLLVAVLGLLFSGMLGGNEVMIDMYAADRYILGCIVLGLSASATLLSANMFKKVEGPVNKGEVIFQKKIINLVIPHTINLLGLTITVYLIAVSGMM
ncbi:MAG: hypothetical protein R6U61_07065 [Thermoplasmata archaeon]